MAVRRRPPGLHRLSLDMSAEPTNGVNAQRHCIARRARLQKRKKKTCSRLLYVPSSIFHSLRAGACLSVLLNSLPTMPLSGIRFSRRCGELLACLTTRKRASRENLKHESSPPPQTCPPLPTALPDYSKLPSLPSDIWTNIFQHLRHRAADAHDTLITDTPPGQVDLSRMIRVNKVRIKLLFFHCAGSVRRVSVC